MKWRQFFTTLWVNSSEKAREDSDKDRDSISGDVAGPKNPIVLPLLSDLVTTSDKDTPYGNITMAVVRSSYLVKIYGDNYL